MPSNRQSKCGRRLCSTSLNYSPVAAPSTSFSSSPSSSPHILSSPSATGRSPRALQSAFLNTSFDFLFHPPHMLVNLSFDLLFHPQHLLCGRSSSLSSHPPARILSSSSVKSGSDSSNLVSADHANKLHRPCTELFANCQCRSFCAILQRRRGYYQCPSFCANLQRRRGHFQP
jgi:hypothetical protein